MRHLRASLRLVGNRTNLGWVAVAAGGSRRQVLRASLGEQRSRIRAAARRSGHGSRPKMAILGVLACLATFLATGCWGSSPLREQRRELLPPDRHNPRARRRPGLRLGLQDARGKLLVAGGRRLLRGRLRELSAVLPLPGDDPHRPLCSQPRGEGQQAPDGGSKKSRDGGQEEDAIATLLQQSGYQTALFGKYLNGYGEEDPTYVPPGRDE